MEILKTALKEIQELGSGLLSQQASSTRMFLTSHFSPAATLTIYVYLPHNITLDVSQKAEKSLEIAKMKLKAEYLNQLP